MFNYLTIRMLKRSKNITKLIFFLFRGERKLHEGNETVHRRTVGSHNEGVGLPGGCQVKKLILLEYFKK